MWSFTQQIARFTVGICNKSPLEFLGFPSGFGDLPSLQSHSKLCSVLESRRIGGGPGRVLWGRSKTSKIEPFKTNLLLQVETASRQTRSQEFNCVYFCHYFLFRARDIGILFMTVIERFLL